MLYKLQYSAVLAGVAIAGYLALRRVIQPADLEGVRRLFASPTDEEQGALLADLRALVEKRGEREQARLLPQKSHNRRLLLKGTTVNRAIVATAFLASPQSCIY